MENIIEITNLYILVLLLALLIERYMEIFMATWNYIEWKFGLEEFWNRRAEKLKKKFETKAKSQILFQVFNLTGLTRQIRSFTRSKKSGHSGKIIIISGDMVRHVGLASVSRIVASILGIVFCSFTRINLVDIFNRSLEFDLLTNWPYWLKITLSGIVVGLGSEPVHSLIMAVEKRREARARRAELEKTISETVQ